MLAVTVVLAIAVAYLLGRGAQSTASSTPTPATSPAVAAPRAEEAGELVRGCEGNLKNLGTALEMWSTDHSGRYPQQLSQVQPAYLKAIPTCPAAGRDTYSSSYSAAEKPDFYRIFCSGAHHQAAGLAVDHPRYDSVQGLHVSRGDASGAREQLVACEANVKSLAMALEVWSTDHSGRFPGTLQEIVPDYASSVPACPAAQDDTYSRGYKSGGGAKPGESWCEVRCRGNHHQAAGAGADRPAWSSRDADDLQGL